MAFSKQAGKKGPWSPLRLRLLGGGVPKGAGLPARRVPRRLPTSIGRGAGRMRRPLIRLTMMVRVLALVIRAAVPRQTDTALPKWPGA